MTSRRDGGKITRMPAIVLILAILLTGLSPSRAQSIGVNFVGGAQANGLDGGVMKRNEEAGAPGFAQRNWNQLRGKFPNDPAIQAQLDDPQRLRDDAGQATGTRVLWTVDRTHRILSYPQTDADFLRRGYLDTTNMPEKAVEVLVENVPYPRYDLVVYVGSEFGGSRGSVTLGDERRFYKNATVTHDSAGPSTRWPDFTEATANRIEDAAPASHAVFRGVTGSNVTFVVRAEGSRQTGVQGFQIRRAP